MGSAILQNPSDPEATFRSQAGKEHRGYVANLEETVGGNGFAVTEYQYKQNTHSDSQFIHEHLKRMDVQKGRTVIVTDGAYSGTENMQLATDKNVKPITTSLTGKEASDIFDDFEYNEEGTRVFKRPAGHSPKSCSYKKQSNQCAVSFLNEQCANCPYRDQCKPKLFKRIAKIIHLKQHMNGQYLKEYGQRGI